MDRGNKEVKRLKGRAPFLQEPKVSISREDDDVDLFLPIIDV